MSTTIKQDDKLLSLIDLAKMIDVSHALLHKAAALDMFSCLKTPGGMRLVPADDEETLDLLSRAAAIYHDRELGLSFDRSLRLAKRGFSLERA
jgi:hypothetical protein